LPDHPFKVKFLEDLVEGVHSVSAARLHEAEQLFETVIPDGFSDGGCGREHLAGKNPAMAFFQREKVVGR